VPGVDPLGRCLRCGRRIECSGGCFACPAIATNQPQTTVAPTPTTWTDPPTVFPPPLVPVTLILPTS
jgi:hypothetical protein